MNLGFNLMFGQWFRSVPILGSASMPRPATIHGNSGLNEMLLSMGHPVGLNGEK